jgi:F-type H+-transporting ATPase subunit b
VSPSLATFFFELVNFLLLAALLAWLLFKPVRRQIESRQAAARQQAADIAARTAEADRLRDQWQQRHAALEEEVAATRAARVAAAEQEADAIVARAREAAGRERDRLVASLAQVERNEAGRLAAAAAAAAGDAVARLLTTIEGPDLESSLIRVACQRLEGLAGALPGAVVVESAHALADRDRDALVAALRRCSVAPVFRVVAELGAGLRVTTSRGLIDASAAGFAAAAERRLKSDLAVETPPPQP